MGISLAWVAVEALPVDEVLSRLSLARSGRTCSYPFKGWPLILAKEVAGFRHDEVAPELDAVPFEELSDLRVRSSRWKFWK